MPPEPLVLRITDGVVSDASNALLAWLGLSREQVHGRPFSELRRLPGQEALSKLEIPEKGIRTAQVIDSKGTHFSVILHAVGVDTEITFTDLTENERARELVSRYVSKDMAGLSEADKSTFSIPERRFMSVSFTDLRGFTAMSERMSPEEVRETINDYLEVVMKAADANKATIDKIVGDEVMVLYGAPRHVRDHALRAVKTALDQQKNLRALQVEYQKRGKVMPECGIGVNTGEMVVGNIGSESRLNYTVLGSAVNLAARLCGAAQGGQVVLTQATLKEILDALPEGYVAIEGQDEAYAVVEKLGGKTEGVFPLPAVLVGKTHSVGPDGAPVFKFRYLYAVKVKGVDEPLPIIEALSIVDEQASQFTDADLMKVLSDTTVDSIGEKVFGKYRLLNLLGRGGMAQVYRARDPFGNDVAVKLLLAGDTATPDQILRFMREGEVMKMLDHRNLCRVMEVGQYEGIHFIAMELLPGVTLGDLVSSRIDTKVDSDNVSELVASAERSVIALKAAKGNLSATHTESASGDPNPPPEPVFTAEGGHRPLPSPAPKAQGKGGEKSHSSRPLPITHALSIFDGVLAGVAAAHEKGIIHRDLKPGNIMIKRSGDPVVMDFGLARFEQSEGDLTQTQAVVGTIDFMAPEQASSSKTADEKSDIFALGAVLYYLVTGQKWFSSCGNLLTDVETLREKNPVLPRLLNPKISKDLQTIILKAMEKEPSRRYQTAQAFREDLIRLQKDEPISAKPPSVVYRVQKFAVKHRKLLVPSSIALSIVLGTVLFVFGEKIKELATWRLAHTEYFSGTKADMASNWVGYWYPNLQDREAPIRLVDFQDLWEIRLETNTMNIAYSPRWVGIYYKHEYDGDLRVEWEMSSPSLSPRLIFCGRDLYDGYTFHLGWNGDWVLSREKSQIFLDSKPAPLAIADGRWHHFRAEKSGNRIRLEVDRKRAFDYEDYDVIGGPGHGAFGFSAVASGNPYIRRLRVYSGSLARKVSPLVVGDAFFRKRQYENAMMEYHKMVASYPDDPIGIEARFRLGLCSLRLGDLSTGSMLLEAFPRVYPASPMAPYAYLEAFKAVHEFDTNRSREIVKKMSSLYRGSQATRSVITFLEARYTKGFSDAKFVSFNESAAYYLACRDQLREFSKITCQSVTNSGFLRRAASFYQKHGQHQKVLDEFPEARHENAMALFTLGKLDLAWSSFPDQHDARVKIMLDQGRFDEISEQYPEQFHSIVKALYLQGKFLQLIKSFPDQRFHCANALLEMGQFNVVLNEYPDQSSACAYSLLGLGRAEEANSKYAGDKSILANLLIQQGRFQEAFYRCPDIPWAIQQALIGMGRYEEALSKYPDLFLDNQFARLARDLEDYVHGQSSSIPPSMNSPYYFENARNRYFGPFLLIPILRHLRGDSKIIREEYRKILGKYKFHYMQMLWNDAALILGEINTPTYLAQPVKFRLNSRQYVAEGMRCEISGHKADALDWYSKWLALEISKTMPDPILPIFVNWRARELRSSTQ